MSTRYRTKESIKFPSIFLDPKQHLGTVQREGPNYFHLFDDSGKMTLIQCLLFPSSCSASTSAWSLPSAPHTAQYRQLQLFLSPFASVSRRGWGGEEMLYLNSVSGAADVKVSALSSSPHGTSSRMWRHEAKHSLVWMEDERFGDETCLYE